MNAAFELTVVFAITTVGLLVWIFLKLAWQSRLDPPEIEWELEPRIRIEMAEAVLYEHGYRLGGGTWETLAVRIPECLASMPKEQAAEIIAEWDIAESS